MTDLVAAVDLGSNSFHLILGRMDQGEFRTLDRLKERVQLAAGLTDASLLTEEAIERGLRCMRRFRQRIEGVQRLRAVGTSALRDARNRADFLEPAQAILGCPIEVVSGEDEGRLIYLGVAHALADDGDPRLVVDIGGGSTELVVGQHFVPWRVESLPMGCVSMTRRYLQTPPHLGEAYAEAVKQAQRLIEGAKPVLLKSNFRHVAGSSGTIESVQEVLRANGWGDDVITRKGVELLHQHLLECGSLLDISMSGLIPDRVEIFPGGFAILAAVFFAFDLKEMEYADGTMLDGVLHDLIEGRSHVNVRSQTIASMQERYHVDRPQARRVEQVAMLVLDQVRADWDLEDERCRMLLQWAIQLHEIGLAVSHVHHQRHAAYLIDHGEMRGFNKPQKRAIAALVRAQRRGISRLSFSGFMQDESRRMLRMALLLRLAVMLNLGRADSAIPEVWMQADDAHIRLTIAQRWLDEHPLSAQQLRDEGERLQALGYELTINR